MAGTKPAGTKPAGTKPAATKPAEACPLCDKTYLQLSKGGHSKAFVEHVQNGKGCKGIGRIFMDETELSAAKERGDEKTAAQTKASFAQAVKKGICPCPSCQAVFAPHVARLSS